MSMLLTSLVCGLTECARDRLNDRQAHGFLFFCLGNDEGSSYRRGNAISLVCAPRVTNHLCLSFILSLRSDSIDSIGYQLGI
jgi:hypothetical protein